MENNLSTEYYAVFLEQAEMRFLNFNVQYMKTDKMKVLRERQRKLNTDFVYTPDIHERMLYFQNVYTQKCREAFEYSKLIEAFVKERMNDVDNAVDDFNLEFEISFFSPKKYDFIEVMDGNPFFTFSISMLYSNNPEFDMFDEILQPEFTAHTTNHPLQGIKHNFLIHELFDHTILAYTDILETENIWVEAHFCVQKIFDL
jgi:hypothetical protein